jgi:DNA repair exonuclease SbcCD nuclease subunit
MRFSHTADCHIGGHRDPRLRALTEEAFERFVTESLELHVDFAIIAGDLFNTAIPGIDALKTTVTQLGRLREAHIPVYAIPGSHDYSPSGKTMLDVLEEAGLLRNVCRGQLTPDGKLRLSFTTDTKTGAKLTGVIGRRGMLDRQLYEELDHTISEEPGEKIFLFHTSITELKPKELQEMESAPVSFLPPGFTYYAGGHVHIVERYHDAQHANVIYPGPLFPNSFSELERLRHGTYFLYDDGTVTRKDILLRDVVACTIDVDGMDGADADRHTKEAAERLDVRDKIVLLRIEGTLRSGSPNDIDLRSIVAHAEERGAYCVLRTTAHLTSPEFAQVQLRVDEPHLIEERLLHEHAAQLRLDGIAGQDAGLTVAGSGDMPDAGIALARDLLRLLAREPLEGEKLYTYQERVAAEALKHIDRSTEQRARERPNVEENDPASADDPTHDDASSRSD